MQSTVLRGAYTPRLFRCNSIQNSFLIARRTAFVAPKAITSTATVPMVKHIYESGSKKMIIYGGSFRPLHLLDAPPFTIFCTIVTLSVTLFFFGAMEPEDYYLSLNRYCIYAWYATAILYKKGIWF